MNPVTDLGVVDSDGESGKIPEGERGGWCPAPILVLKGLFGSYPVVNDLVLSSEIGVGGPRVAVLPAAAVGVAGDP